MRQQNVWRWLFSITCTIYAFIWFELIEGKKVYWSSHLKMQLFNVFVAVLVWLVEVKREPRSTTGKERMLRLSPAI